MQLCGCAAVEQEARLVGNLPPLGPPPT
jgi:hypothetical protein